MKGALKGVSTPAGAERIHPDAEPRVIARHLLGHRDDGMFGGGIGDHLPVIQHAGAGGGVHDHTLSGGAHVRHHQPRPQKMRTHIQRPGFVKACQANLLQIAFNLRARMIVQNVDAALSGNAPVGAD